MNENLEIDKVCWNCARANRLHLDSLKQDLFTFCDSYKDQGICEYSPIKSVKVKCSDCANFDDFSGCEYGISCGDSRCQFTPVSLDESDYFHQAIVCPLYAMKSDCRGYNLFTGKFEPCDDCPIEWKKLRRSVIDTQRPKDNP